MSRMTRYRGGTYSHTVDTIVFTDGTSARTDLIRLNPNIEAYSLDFTAIAPTRPSRYAVDTWAAVPHLRARAHEAEVDWILRNSVSDAVDFRRSAAGCARRGTRWARRNIGEHEAIAGHAGRDLVSHQRPANSTPGRSTCRPRMRRGTDGVTVEFDDAPNSVDTPRARAAQARDADVAEVGRRPDLA